MKRNALREELCRLIAAEGQGRRPAIRRSLQEDWVYATDLPGIVSDGFLAETRESLRKAGWDDLITETGWMLLRKDAWDPPEGWYDGPFGPEAGCCLSLLNRHPERGREQVQRIEYALIRAGEEGAKAYEETCGRLHREWAERLRKKQKLPDVSPKYFGGG